MQKKHIIIAAVYIALLFAASTVARAESRVLINSADWQDVYSGTMYSNLKGMPSNFLTGTRHATIITYSIPKTIDGIEVVSSRSNPFVVNYKGVLESDGYKNVTELRMSNANLELLDRLPGITKFIVIDDSYGYNAISVAPYAILGKYYVLFADRRTIGQVSNALGDRDVDEVMIYGQVDREVKNALQEYDPKTISTGDRFDNNIEIVKLYQELHKRTRGGPRRQAILSNGEFMEQSIMSGSDPVLFIGFSNVPEQVRDYIATSDLDVGTLVGNELIGSATFIRRQTGLSVFVKFGQGSRVPTDTIAQVEDLDRFPIPRYPLNLEISSALINTATQRLEVTYRNRGQVGTYFRNILIRISDEDTATTIPDENEATFVDANSYKTMTYELKDGEGNAIEVSGDSIYVNLTTVYGESSKSLEQTITASLRVQEVSILDEANIDILSAEYAKQGSRFLVKVKNVGTVDAYTVAETHDIVVNSEFIVYSSEGTVKIAPGQTKVLVVDTDMTDLDIPDNEKVKVKVVYGERENALIKIKESTFDFKLAAPDLTLYILVLLIILILLLFFLKKKCKHCGEKNPVVRKTCKKCGKKL